MKNAGYFATTSPYRPTEKSSTALEKDYYFIQHNN